MLTRLHIFESIVVALCIACTGQNALPYGTVVDAPPAVAATTRATLTDAQCAHAQGLRARVPELLRQGLLDRATRVISRANEDCPSEAHLTWSEEVATLADVGRYKEARNLARHIQQSAHATREIKTLARRAEALVHERDLTFDDTDQAKQAMRAHGSAAHAAMEAKDYRNAEDLFLKAWTEWHPNGQALLGAGLAAKRRGDAAQSQRLFDRAVEDFKASNGATLVQLEVPTGEGDVRELAWAPDGKRFAVGDGHAISIVDATTRRIQRRFEGHTGYVESVAFSPDGATLASGSWDSTVRLWSLSTGKQIRVLSGHKSTVKSVRFSPNGKFIASASVDQTVRIWSVDSTNAPDVLDGHTGVVSSVAYSPDGKTLVASADKTIHLWKLSDNINAPRPLQTSSPVLSVAFSPDSSTLAWGSEDGAVRIWKIDSGSPRILGGHAREVDAVAFAPDGRAVASGSSDRTVKIWGVHSGFEVLTGHSDAIRSVAYSPNGATLASTSFDGTIRLWTMGSKGAARVVGRPRPGTEIIAVSSSGATLATASDELVRIWTLGSAEPPRLLKGHTDKVTSLAFAPDGSKLASGSEDKSVRVWDLSSTASAPLQLRGASGVLAVAFSPDSRTVASGSWYGTVSLWKIGSKEAPEILKGHTGWVTSVAFSRDGQSLASGAMDDKTVRIWRPGSSDPPRIFEGAGPGFESVAFSQDGKLLAAAPPGKDTLLWHLDSNAPPEVIPGGRWIAFSPDNKTLACGSGGLAIGIWQLGPPLSSRLLGTGDSAFSGAFLPDGERLVTGWRGETRLWSLTASTLLLTLRGVPGSTGGYAFTPDGFVSLLGNDARSLLSCRIGASTYPLDLCEERFVVPTLFAQVMAGDASYRNP